MNITSKIAAKIDAKVDAGKVVTDWRNFLHWFGTQWNIAGFFVAVGYSAALAAGVIPFRSLYHGRYYDVAVFALLACVFLGSMWYRLKPQPGIKAEMAVDETDQVGA